MPKLQAFVDELGIEDNPRIYRKGYLFKETKEDTNGNVSSFDDVKTLNKILKTNSGIRIFSDLHFTKWDHSYGSTHNQNTALPNDTEFFDETWVKTTPAGSSGTSDLMNSGSTGAENGTLMIECTSAQTVSYHKTGIISDISTSTGCLTVDFSLKKGGSESSNANPFTVQVKMGQFHVQVVLNLTTVTLKEVGTAGTNVSCITGTSNESGQYAKMRLIINRAIGDLATLLIGDSVVAEINKSINNGSTTDNEIRFGYLAVPTSTSRTFINYIRYHNSPFYPIYLPSLHAFPYRAGINDFMTIQSGTFSTNTNVITNASDEHTFSNEVTGATDVLCRSTITPTTNALGNAYEIRGYIGGASSSKGSIVVTLEDGTISNTLTLYGIGHSTLNDGIKFNGTTVTGVKASEIHTYRIVCRGNGSGATINSYLYVDGELKASQSNTTSTANTRFDLTFANTNAAGTSTYRVQEVKLFLLPAFYTRFANQAYLAIMPSILSNEATTYYVGSDVVLNDLNDIVAAPKLTSLSVFQKDLSWGDTGFESVSNMQYRGSATSFSNLLVSAEPAWTSVTVPDGSIKRDPITKHSFKYFQVRIPISKLTQEITFFRFHRQLDVTDYVTSWGQSTFERDFISRKLNAGDLRVQLMNPDDDFDLLRQRPDLWINAMWETWIGATTSSGDLEYPDFIGTVDDIVFESNVPYIVCSISNNIKALRELKLNNGFQYPPFSKLKTFAGGTCFGVSTRKDTTNDDIYWLDSKYDLNEANGFTVYVDEVAQSAGSYAFSGKAPGKIDFSSPPSGTVTIDFKPLFPFNTDNASLIIQRVIQKDAGLLLNHDIDSTSFNTFETDIDSISLNNVEISETKLLDFLENVAIQSAASPYISPENQTALGISTVSKIIIDYEIISDRNLSEFFHQCEYIHTSNPVENCVNTIDFTYNSESLKSNFTYVNRRTIGEYDENSPKASSSLISIFGIKSPSSRITDNPSTFFNILTDYPYHTSIANLNTVIDRNFAPFGYRPAIYDLYGLSTNVFLYSVRDMLQIMRDSTTIPDDTILITRLVKDYDNLTGSVQGLSNRFFQFGGGSSTLKINHAVPDTVCENYPTLDPCTVTSRTLNPADPTTANAYWVAVSASDDPDVSYATLSGF